MTRRREEAVGRRELQLQAIEGRARNLIEFSAALEDVGLDGLARRSRVVATDQLRLVEELRMERIARLAIQERAELSEAILADHAGRAARIASGAA